MNKIFSPSICLIALFMTACAGSERSAGVATNSASNASSNRSFTDFAKNQPASPINQGDLADQKAQRGYGFGNGIGGGGGGGGGKTDPSVRAEQISLTQASSSQNDAVPVDRKIIRNGQLGIEADKPEEIQQRISGIAQSKGGFVVASQQSSSDPLVSVRDVVEMSVRVPADKFAEAVADQVRPGPDLVRDDQRRGRYRRVHRHRREASSKKGA